MAFINHIVAGFHITGSFMMWGILIIALITVGFCVERIWYLYVKCGTNRGTFMSGISRYIKAGDFEKAIKYASSVSTPLAKTILAVLSNRGKGRKAASKAVDEVFLSEAPKITQRIALLSMFANLATLVGLSATVYGVMVDFDAIANVPVAQRAQALAAGISIALSGTLFGLMVAIPALVVSGFLAAKADALIEE
ncbi:MAG TPA: MotA/TolQ/ExbB proton channel family protein [Fibrobacteres bacterium]|nr:MotA/TolQ/ExbB proton channel family protein [Fibrobacterota bacterium]